MPAYTEKITYSLKDRGRVASGIPRQYKSIDAIVRAINSAECQERVKNRDMLGYWGHYPRQRFGMIPIEGGWVDGKAVRVEPAFVTVELSATKDGQVTHRAEFLPTETGELVAKLNEGRVGGFSTAIDETLSPVLFAGMDYVGMPNFTGNRPYTLDSGADYGDSEYIAMVTAARLVLDSGASMFMPADGLALNSAMKRISALEAENAELLDALVRRGINKPTLDSGYSLGVHCQNAHAAALLNDAAMFGSAVLPRPVDHDDISHRLAGQGYQDMLPRSMRNR